MTSVQAERSATTLAQRWCALAVFLIAPFVFASLRWRQVEWRGRAYELTGSSRARRAGRATTAS